MKNNQTIKGGRGGARSGAGRKPGSPNLATIARQAEVAASGITPLDFMLQVMRDPEADKAQRLDMAKAAAPYVHPRLAAIEHTGDLTLHHEDALGELE